MKKYRFITEKETQYIIDNHKKKSRAELARTLNRSRTAIQQVIVNLNLNPISASEREDTGWVLMYKFAKSLNPKYTNVTDAFNEYGKDQFIKLYKSQA